MKFGRGAAVVCAVLGICPGATTAWAQPKGSAPADKAEAETDASAAEFDKHFAAGKAAADVNRWDTARQEFLKAFELRPDHAQTVALLAQAEIATGRHREAAEHLDIFLEYAVGISAKEREVAEQLLIEAQTKLAIVTIKVDKSGAKIRVDGRVLGTSPLAEPVPVDIGHRRFEADGPDGRASVEVDLEPRTTPTIEMVLKAPEAKVIKESQTWRTGAIFGTMGLGVAGIGVGVGFLVASFDKHAEAQTLADKIALNRFESESICPPNSTDSRCAELLDLQSSRDTMRNVSVAGFIVGGVATASMLALWLTAPSKTPDKKQANVIVVPTPGGVLLTGTF